MESHKFSLSPSLKINNFQDLFPDIDCPTVGNPEFTGAVQHVLHEKGYVPMSDQVILISTTTN